MKKLQFLKAGDYMKTITRAKYLDRIIELNGTPDIKIITGIRRSGKSKLMQAYIAYLKSNFENINIIFIDFMDLAYEEIKEYHALHAYVEEHYQEGILFLTGVDVLGRVVEAAVVTHSLLVGRVGVVALLHEVHHLAQVYKLIADDQVIVVQIIFIFCSSL